MEPQIAVLIFSIAGGLLALIISLLLLYMVIRAAVSHALARHRDELRDMFRGTR